MGRRARPRAHGPRGCLLSCDPVDPAAASPPRVLGRYALYDAIAAGGMATVHLGRLLGHVGFERTVAIKRLHPQFAQDPEFVSMFLDEARVVARIRHPNVVPTLDVVAVDGEIFIVMEYVQGESLARLIKAALAKGTRIPPPFAVTMLAGVLHGLHAAHEARSERGQPLEVVHRDISPQNILVGIDGVARVLDFGVAKAAGRLQTTREGQLKGKLGYMAPEQISGVTGRGTDVYAASVVLWEALTGRRLFIADSEAHTMKLVLENRVSPPSELAADLPPALDALVLRGLSREPADRYPTARDMALALEEVLPPVTPSKLGAWVESMAEKTLGDRSERIAAIESSSSSGTPIAKPVSAGGPATGALPTRTEDEPPTQLSSSSASLPERGGRVPSGAGRRTRVLAVGAGLGAVALLVALSTRTSGSRSGAATSGPQGAVSPPPPAADSAPLAPAPSVVASGSLAGATASSAPSASIAAKAGPRPQRPPAQRPPAARAPGADDGTSDRK
jgi:eukaryotic-like serine/threonine-protein kinase